jgi:hypothetical protein
MTDQLDRPRTYDEAFRLVIHVDETLVRFGFGDFYDACENQLRALLEEQVADYTFADRSDEHGRVSLAVSNSDTDREVQTIEEEFLPWFLALERARLSDATAYGQAVADHARRAGVELLPGVTVEVVLDLSRDAVGTEVIEPLSVEETLLDRALSQTPLPRIDLAPKDVPSDVDLRSRVQELLAGDVVDPRTWLAPHRPGRLV